MDGEPIILKPQGFSGEFDYYPTVAATVHRTLWQGFAFSDSSDYPQDPNGSQGDGYIAIPMNSGDEILEENANFFASVLEVFGANWDENTGFLSNDAEDVFEEESMATQMVTILPVVQAGGYSLVKSFSDSEVLYDSVMSIVTLPPGSDVKRVICLPTISLILNGLGAQPRTFDGVPCGMGVGEMYENEVHMHFDPFTQYKVELGLQNHINAPKFGIFPFHITRSLDNNDRGTIYVTGSQHTGFNYATDIEDISFYATKSYVQIETGSSSITLLFTTSNVCVPDIESGDYCSNDFSNYYDDP